MPSATFFNLPEEKRQKLISAAWAEFCRVPYEQASINKIVQGAGIPRGSFYMYFTDKDDLLVYLLGRYIQQIIERAMLCLRETDGDLFAVPGEIYGYIVELNATQGQDGFFSHLLGGVRMDAGSKLATHLTEISDQVSMRNILALVNRDLLNLSGDRELEDLIHMLVLLTLAALVRSYKECDHRDEIKRQLLSQVEMIKRGMRNERGTKR